MKMNAKAKTVLVGLSGGVDSAVAAALLLRQGYRVIGASMRTWEGGNARGKSKHGCYGADNEKNIEQARSIASALGIPFHIINLSHEFKEDVLDYFRSEYLAGRTPNPCVRCNRYIKFGALLEEASRIGIEYDYFATGHYARIEWDAASQRYLLQRGRDSRKDQSYFLYGLSQEQLAHTLFPLGEMLKAEVKDVYRTMGLGLADRKESQDFACGGYTSLFVAQPGPGPLIDRQGRVLGLHRGIIHYTPGQRRGLGLASPEPLFVIEIRADSNEIVVGHREELYTLEQVIGGINWVSIPVLEGRREVRSRVRSTHIGYDAFISPLDESQVRVTYTTPQPAAARGQSVVFYDRDTVLGGGIAL